MGKRRNISIERNSDENDGRRKVIFVSNGPVPEGTVKRPIIPVPNGEVECMSLRFYFGAYDEDKSIALYEEIIQRAQADEKTNFLLLVPDQFTMQTQKQLVTMHPDGGIWNIDVLSFGRLNHRIMEEVGKKDVPVLDDTGKSLVLEKVAAGIKGELPVLGSQLHRQGYIHEVKSAISEFMQYGISVKDMDGLAEFAQKKGALSLKLKDLSKLYEAFTEYIHGHFITTEETLDVLAQSLNRSELIRNSVIVLDGFTGFTPIQNRLIQELMRLSKETIVSITMGQGEDPYQVKGEQELFYLSKKTQVTLEKLASEVSVERDRSKDVFVTAQKDSSRALMYLQQNLFAYNPKPFEEEQDQVRLFETTKPETEVHQCGLMIHRLVQEEGFAYRDIAVIMGDLESYAPYVETEFARLHIPCFLDRTRAITLNPMIELIRSAIKLFLTDFSYESVMHYLRTGMCAIPVDHVDILDNFLLRTGIRGYGKYRSRFTSRYAKSVGEETLEILNHVREQLIAQVEPLHIEKQGKTKDYVSSLYDFLVANRVQEQLKEYEMMFTEKGNLSKAKEYAQIYRLVMELLEQIYELLGEEVISMQEFADLLDAGFGEIEVGIIPQNVDRVLVGDMERTRIHSVKVLFFLGANDGNIPRNAQKGGIISDLDREFLQQSGFELAPTPRQQMFIQRFYLYLNLSKPTRRLYVAYSRMNSSGNSLRPAYLVDRILKLFPGMSVEYPQNRSMLEQIGNEREGLDMLAKSLRSYADGLLDEESEQEFFTLYETYRQSEQKERADALREAAFIRYEESPLSAAVARALYGTSLVNSVTRLEVFASCAYSHFLKYGLSLKEREEFGFETVDMGNIYHGVLEGFADRLTESKTSWFDFTPEFAKEAVENTLNEWAASYGDTILYSSARNVYMIRRMKRILYRTVMTLQKQLRRGSFLPDDAEVSFTRVQDLSEVSFGLTEEEKLTLMGRIDRVDVAKDEDHVYVKIVDYKSGDRAFDFAALYYGLQLQLVVYMDAAMKLQERKNPGKEIVPAAMLYYHVDDPAVESKVELSQEELDEKILKELRTKGMVNSDDTVCELLDRGLEGSSLVVPIERKKDGTISARSSVLSREEYDTVSDYVNKKIRQIGRDILSGTIRMDPYELDTNNACTYCPYKKVCGFDNNIPGCEMRKLVRPKQEEILELMKAENTGEAKLPGWQDREEDLTETGKGGLEEWP